MNQAVSVRPVMGPSSSARQRLLAAIDRLPQRAYLDPINIERWMDYVLRIDPDRADWHVRRLSGIGGSEIGPLVLASRGDYSMMGSAYDLVAEKLMFFGPKPPKDNMRRGQDIEPMVRTVFTRDFGAKSLEKDLEFLRGASHPEIPWMVGSPDELVLLGGRRFLVDYKSPNEKTVEEYERTNTIPLEYVCQLHHYRCIGVGNGMSFDGMLLAPLDWVKWSIPVRAIEYDPKLEAEMIAVGSHIWNNFVMRGKLPPKRVREALLPTEEQLEQLGDLPGQVIIARTLAKVASESAKALDLKLLDRLSGYRLDDEKLSLGGVDVTEKREVDQEEVERRLLRHGRDISEFSYRGDLDPAKVSEVLVGHPEIAKVLEEAGCYRQVPDYEAAISALAGANEDISGCYTATHTLRVSSKKKGPDADIVALAAQVARKAISEPIEADAGQLIDEYKARVAAEEKALAEAAAAKEQAAQEKAAAKETEKQLRLANAKAAKEAAGKPAKAPRKSRAAKSAVAPMELPGGLYILSGISGSGKSTLLARSGIPAEMVVSTESIRRELLTAAPQPKGNSHQEILAVAVDRVTARLKEGLTTFVDSTSLTEESREFWDSVACEHDAPMSVILVDVPVDLAMERNRARPEPVPEESVASQAARFQRDSRFPLIKAGDHTVLQPAASMKTEVATERRMPAAG